MELGRSFNELIILLESCVVDISIYYWLQFIIIK